jgi:hypothetical protein
MFFDEGFEGYQGHEGYEGYQFCVSCAEVVNEDPLGVLCRMVDEDGRRAICARCRGAIWRAQRAVQSGAATFAFENPNRSAVAEVAVAEVAVAEVAVAEKLEVASASAAAASSASAPRVLEAAAPGWLCRRCGAPVAARPRAFEGGAEPEDWWWCRGCQAKRQKTQKTQKTQESQQGSKRHTKSAGTGAGCERLARWLAGACK